MQICANFHKFWNNMMSNDGLIIENMDMSHIYFAVLINLFNFAKISNFFHISMEFLYVFASTQKFLLT